MRTLERKRRCSMLLWGALALLVGACGEAGGEEPGSWREALAAVKPEQAIYSLAYEGAPPTGQFLRLSFHPGEDAGGACGRYDASSGAGGDFWYLLLTLNGSGPGHYTLVPEPDGQGGTLQASIRVLRVQGWKQVEDYAATGGTLSLEQVPSDAEGFREGSRLVGTLQAEFPAHPLRQVQCSGEMQPGGTPHQWCTCADESGATSTCESDGSNCCHATDAERVPFEMTFEAAPCASMCVAPPSLLSHCDALRH